MFSKIISLKKVHRGMRMKLLKKERIGNIRKITILDCINLLYEKKEKPQDWGYFGDYSSFDEVNKLCAGYDAENILEKTLESTLKVKNGEAVFERDTYIFDKIQYSFPLLACLFKVAVNCNNKLNIIDFGGALGSHYFQNKEFLKPINIEKWTVVEQEHYTNIGNQKVADGILNFKNTIDEVEDANLFLSSSTLQYLEKPYEWLEKFINKDYEYMLFDRIQFNTENKDRLTLQIVPDWIYPAKYPSWFLNEEKFLSVFKNKYELILDFDSTIDSANIPHKYKGYLFKKSIKNFNRK